MVKCPICKKEINYLINTQKTIVSFNLTIEGDNICYNNRMKDNKEDNNYYCPKCRVLVAESEEKAIGILKGE